MTTYLVSRKLPVRHGFFTRRGGVSPPPFDSLNVGVTTADSREAVDENFGRVSDALAVSGGAIAAPRQVHGHAVWRVTLESIRADPPEADAVWTDAPGIGVGVRTADCAPILLADRRLRRVAAVHAGWRGAVADVVGVLLHEWQRLGSQPADVTLAIGPTIAACCFRVGPEVASEFSRVFGQETVLRDDGGFRVDLPMACVLAATRKGIAAQNIDVLGECTSCRRELYYSHRRDGGATGRHLSGIVCDFARLPATSV